ncbi:TPA: hypothetical protein ACUI40_000739 [Klebsiella pneumoniae]|uniref:hypothetical protein n=1 Tax=Klebsiella pneumoniae TaxID=573 RepID=UPI0013300496|nr:hypothetical protein [Klebsiella pneumoniae]MBC5061434.1 hypothetical protein [Klebsiella pneumoniae]MDY2399763.1 hypothetical protein [Klebsiella pneumoniae]MEE2321564.1 hypothetical protein [Klebsiella pneumoniae]HBQ3069319.1 hypothetical protein [Klebsiella pneumoniae]
MKNDTDLPQSVTILEHVQKPTKQRFFVIAVKKFQLLSVPKYICAILIFGFY